MWRTKRGEMMKMSISVDKLWTFSQDARFMATLRGASDPMGRRPRSDNRRMSTGRLQFPDDRPA